MALMQVEICLNMILGHSFIWPLPKCLHAYLVFYLSVPPTYMYLLLVQPLINCQGLGSHVASKKYVTKI